LRVVDFANKVYDATGDYPGFAMPLALWRADN
jgi:hypothetical protein